jgi:peroxiredoxin
MELNALQKLLPEIEQAGAKLVAVTPETPDNSLTTREKNELAFDILFDEGAGLE